MTQPELIDIYYRLKIFKDELEKILDELKALGLEPPKAIQEIKRPAQEPHQEPVRNITTDEIKGQILKELEQRKIIPLIDLEKRYKDQKAILDQALRELQNERKIKIVNNYISLEIQNMPTTLKKKILG